MSNKVNVQVAREHVEQGEGILSGIREATAAALAAGVDMDDTVDLLTATAAIATAHFSAAMAITNILLTDPAEFPEPAEL